MKTIDESQEYKVVLAGSQILALRDILVALHPQPADPDGPYKLIQALEGAEEA